MCRKFNVSGRVQGVFFRDSTRQFAEELGLSGYAINLSDGSVEVLLCGADERIETLRQWLRHGPPLASVAQVSEKPMDCSNPVTFSTG